MFNYRIEKWTALWDGAAVSLTESMMLSSRTSEAIYHVNLFADCFRVSTSKYPIEYVVATNCDDMEKIRHKHGQVSC